MALKFTVHFFFLFCLFFLRSTTEGQRILVEVYSVRMLNVDGEDPGELYGEIALTGDEFTENIYKRARQDYESVRPGETILLTGPNECMSLNDDNTYAKISLSLEDKELLEAWDDNVIQDSIQWDVSDDSGTDVYDSPIYKNVFSGYGGTGKATVNYIVMKDAVQAKVEVTMINGANEATAEVYGLIAARSSKFPNQESVLFRKKSSKFIEVDQGKLIPLSRSAVAVPLNSSLIVLANLFDEDGIFARDDAIAQGNATFPAQLSGFLEKNITGTSGVIRVKVTWSN